MSDVGMVQVEINYETVANIHVSHVTWHRIVPVEVERNNQNCFQMCVFGSLWREWGDQVLIQSLDLMRQAGECLL